jgi:tetratricopeptide (TPR) repeat protein
MAALSVLLSFSLVSALTFASTPPLSRQHQHDTGQPPDRLGRVEFSNSCDPAVAADFNRAVALLHSFWYRAAIEAFTAVAEKDPACGMAWWGVAMSRWGNPFAPTRPPAALAAGGEAVAKATAAGAKTERERGFIAAVAELFGDFETVDHRTRVVSYATAMERVHRAYPDDDEAAAFYALALNQTMDPNDKTYGPQLQAAAILEPLFERHPEHPGIAHYLIHAYDHPPLADKALPAARLYASIAPDAPHALHMPSHTFTRVGYWEDSITTNLASAEAARRADSPGEVLHAFDYQVYAYLQIAQDQAARRVMKEIEADAKGLNLGEQYGPVGLFARMAIPARYALERGAWAEAAALEPRPSAFPYIDAMTHYARAIGAARTGDAAAANAEARTLADLQQKLEAASEKYWAQQVEIQRTAAEGWAAFAEGRPDEAVQRLRAAADLEDTTDKAAITPGPLAPARELLGELLLELDRPGDALVELQAVLKKEPNRFRATYFAARAAEQAGDAAKAREYYGEVVRIAEGAEAGGRPELAEARQKAGR